MNTSIVGLDLAGVETRPTGFCKLTNLRAEVALLYTDQEIRERTLECNPQVIAIDAPLWLPAGRKNLEERDTNHFRDSDRALLKVGIKIFPPTLGPMRKLTERGIRIRKFFQQKGFGVIEVYPGGAQDVLGIPRKKQGIEKLRLGLETLGIEGLIHANSNHELDAATCAYTAKLFIEDKAMIYGIPSQGIVMPKGKLVK